MWYEKLKKEFDENPLAVIGVAALATTAISKIIDSLSAVQGRRAYAKQVRYKTRNK